MEEHLRIKYGVFKSVSDENINSIKHVFIHVLMFQHCLLFFVLIQYFPHDSEHLIQIVWFQNESLGAFFEEFGSCFK